VIVTDDDAFAARLRAFRTHGIEKDAAMMEAHGGWHYEMRHLGFNYRITDFQAALGLSQLNKLDRFVAERQALAGFYDAALADLPHVSFLRYDHAERSCAYHLYPLLFDLSALGGDKKTLFKALRAEGLGVQVHYIPVPRHPYYRALGYDPAATPGAEEFFRREISIPMFVGVSEHDRADVAAACRKVVQNLA
jgi:dTDP-4-amino-4,6-dideoxygalactose transaminase